jgi:cytosine/adenosine deaminase-related metal-dependent hydrolase
LGTDVGAGYSISMFDAMRQAIIKSKIISFTNKSSKPLTISESFSLATLNGAISLGF